MGSQARKMRRQQLQSEFKQVTKPPVNVLNSSNTTATQNRTTTTRAEQEEIFRRGVEAGVRKATLFTISAWETALEYTKGIGEKKIAEAKRQFQYAFHDVDRFKDTVEDKEFNKLNVAYLVNEEELCMFNSIKEYLETEQSILTKNEILSLLNNDKLTPIEINSIVDKLNALK